MGTTFQRLHAGDLLGDLFNQLHVGLVEVQLDGRIAAANDRFCELIDSRPERLDGLAIQDLMHTSDRADFQDSMQRLAAGGGPFVREARLLTRTGRPAWVEVAASPLRGSGHGPGSAALVVLDITARKRADERAAESARRFHEMADASPVFIWTSGTDRHRRHTWVNSRWADFRGQPLEEELGRGWVNGVHPDDVEACLSAYSLACDRRAPFTVEYRLRRADSEYRWMLDTGAPILDEEGRFVGYVGSLIDITERKASEVEREALLTAERMARSEAEHSNRLKDEFLSVLSHELRTPLNAVLGWTHLLQTTAGTSGPDQQALVSRGLSTIERNARLQSRMIDDLLDMGGVLAGKMGIEPKPVALDKLVESALESLQPQLEARGLTATSQLDEAAGSIEGDASRLLQVVTNLLSNALKFTPSGGRIDVRLHAHDGAAVLSVADNGPGIDADFLPFVFERFRQGDASTRRPHGGLGIGLALVKSLVELHGGTVTAQSDGRGKGATFIVRLPFRQASVASVEMSSSSGGPS